MDERPEFTLKCVLNLKPTYHPEPANTQYNLAMCVEPDRQPRELTRKMATSGFNRRLASQPTSGFSVELSVAHGRRPSRF